jgi:hypothetical protein
LPCGRFLTAAARRFAKAAVVGLRRGYNISVRIFSYRLRSRHNRQRRVRGEIDQKKIVGVIARLAALAAIRELAVE